MEQQSNVRVVVWNLAWRRVSTPVGQELRSRILAQGPDVVCLTEAHTNFDLGAGHWISAQADYGYPLIEGRRKVLMWSRQPWSEVDTIGHPSLPAGRFVSARTNTPIGQVKLMGVCIPWDAAHVSSGRRDRKRWDEHLLYIRGLRQVIEHEAPLQSTLLLGDFNQTVPRSRAPSEVHGELIQTLGDTFELATAGEVAGFETLTIDHIAFSRDLQLRNVTGISSLAHDGEQLSDHRGVAATLEVARRPE